jgi:hypothetical protein
MRSSWVLGVFIAGFSATASAEPRVDIEARMFMRETGQLDDPLFKDATAISMNNLDYGVLADEMLIDVTVPDGTGDRLIVTVKQGKLNLKQSWTMNVGSPHETGTAHYPLLVSPMQCGGPMTIVAKVGKIVEKRIVSFTCSE